MCHLTATGQTVPVNATSDQMVLQSSKCWSTYFQAIDDGVEKAKFVHYNFMARGEPLLNPNINSKLLKRLDGQSEYSGLFSRFLISTIMPVGLRKQESFLQRFRTVQPEIYYSMYSVNPDFRKHWLPAAMPVEEALDLLKEYQDFSKKVITIHYALIKGQNDSSRDVQNVALEVARKGLRVNVNLVQYNPPDDTSETPDDVVYNRAAWAFRDVLPESAIKVVPKVGYDVKASCGMFVDSVTNASFGSEEISE